jgi:hypothetical protein
LAWGETQMNLTATQARRKTNKAKNGMKTYMSPFHYQEIVRAANKGYNFVEFKDYSEFLILALEAYGFKTSIRYKFGLFGKSYLVVSW